MKIFKSLFLWLILFVSTAQAQLATTNSTIKIAWDYDLNFLESNMVFNVYRLGLDGQKTSVGVSDSSLYSGVTNNIATFILPISLTPGTNTLVVTAFSSVSKLESFDSEKLFLPYVPKNTVIKIIKIQ